MNVDEFSNEFDVLYDNITSRSAPGLNKYDKSVFLTRAQEEIVKDYLEGIITLDKQNIDTSVEKYLGISELIEPVTASVTTDTISLPYNVFYILNESLTATFTDGTVYNNNVNAITDKQYQLFQSKIYLNPPKRTVYRLLYGDLDNTNTNIKLVLHNKFKPSAYTKVYSARIVQKPSPIVLEDFELDADLSGLGLTVEGVNTTTECKLNSIVHPDILKRAVELAKAAYIGDLNAFVQINDKPVQ
jgi:hypothetical protein